MQHLPLENDEWRVELAGHIICGPAKLRLNHEDQLLASFASLRLRARLVCIGSVAPVECPFCRLRQKRESQLLGSLTDFGQVLASVLGCFWVDIRPHHSIQISDQRVNNNL